MAGPTCPSTLSLMTRCENASLTRLRPIRRGTACNCVMYLPVLGERHRRDADVVALLQEQQRAAAALVRDAVPEGRPANGGSAEDLDLMRTLQELEYRSDHRVFKPEAPRDLEATGFSPEVQLLERELREQILAQAGLGDRRRRVGVEAGGCLVRVRCTGRKSSGGRTHWLAPRSMAA